MRKPGNLRKIKKIPPVFLLTAGTFHIPLKRLHKLNGIRMKVRGLGITSVAFNKRQISKEMEPERAVDNREATISRPLISTTDQPDDEHPGKDGNRAAKP